MFQLIKRIESASIQTMKDLIRVQEWRINNKKYMTYQTEGIENGTKYGYFNRNEDK